MTDPMDSPRLATAKLHWKLRDRMYRHAEKHNLTGFEAAGVLFALATEVMTSTLVRDGLLQGGPDWAEEEEQLEQDIPVPAEVKVDAASDAEAKLLAIIDCAHDRIADLESALRETAQLLFDEDMVLRGHTAGDELRLAERGVRVCGLLERFGLISYTQEPQS
jgi:hypothetical protein